MNDMNDKKRMTREEFLAKRKKRTAPISRAKKEPRSKKAVTRKTVKPDRIEKEKKEPTKKPERRTSTQQTKTHKTVQRRKKEEKKYILFEKDRKVYKRIEITKKLVNLFKFSVFSAIMYFVVTILLLLVFSVREVSHRQYRKANKDIQEVREKLAVYEKKEREQQEYEKDQSKLTLDNINNLNPERKRYFMELVPSGFPFRGETVITSDYGMRNHPVSGSVKQHGGLDFRAAEGTDVIAPAMGEVVFSGVRGGYGVSVTLKHNFGFTTVYAHLNESLVSVGDMVGKGQVIAKSGNTGVSTGPHLHYEVRYNEEILDPTNFIQWDEKNFDIIFKNERGIQWEYFLKIMKKHQQ